MPIKNFQNFMIRFVNLKTGIFHEKIMTGKELEMLKILESNSGEIQIINVMEAL